jgi:ribosomal-protein-alanine N-acetyltransferase
MEMAATEVVVRWMTEKDLHQVVEIEQRSFADGWDEKDFRRIASTTNSISMVAEQVGQATSGPAIIGQLGVLDRGPVVGFIVYEMYRHKLCLTNMAVDPECRRAGVGSKLVSRLKTKLSTPRRRKIVLEVRESNMDALKFFAAQGFRATGMSRLSFQDTGEDGICMEYKL